MQNDLYYKPVFKVIGIGGTGRRIINKIVENKINIESLFIDIDQKDIELSNANEKLYIQTNKDINNLSKLDLSLIAWDYRNQIKKFSENSDLVFIVCNSSGKTASTISSVVGEILREQKTLTMGLCVKDFYTEDTEKLNNTKQCIKELYYLTNSLVVISNERALNYFDVNEPNIRVLNYVNNVVTNVINIVEGVSQKEGLINVDFFDVKSLLENGGLSMVGEGSSISKENPIEAVRKAMASPLMEISTSNIKSIVIEISSTPDITMADINDIISEVVSLTRSDIDIIFGSNFYYRDDNIKEIKVRIIATFDENDVDNNNLLDYIINNYSIKNINNFKPLKNNNIFSNSQKNVDINVIRYRTVLQDKVVKNSYGMINILIYDDKYTDFVNNYLQNKNIRQLLPLGDSKNEVIKVVISSPELNINEDAKEMYWNNTCLDFPFYFFVPMRYNKDFIPFIITIYINNIIVSSLIYNVKLHSDYIIINERKDYSSAFISYSSNDVDKAAMIVQGIKQARPDMQIFFDKTSIRAGDNWEKVIMAELDKKDVLFLLWSENAKNSEWVDKEWRYVYNTKGEEYIEPIPLESNCGSFLPKELQHKHCNDMLTLLYSDKNKK